MNWLEVQQLLESMQKNMDCPICLEIMKNPVTTTCNHNFCNFCIGKFLNTKRYVPCPMCKVLLSRRSLRENSKLQNIIDKVKKLVSAIETDTGWTYTPPTKNQTLQARRKRQKANSVKRKISLEDNDEVLDETITKNTRFGKRRKSIDTKDKDSLCNDSPSSGLTNLDKHNVSNDLGLEPCSPDMQEAVSCVTPPPVLYRKERKDKLITKEDSLDKRSARKTVPSRNLRSTQVRSSDADVHDSLFTVDDRSQKLEALVDLARQIVRIDSLDGESLMPIPIPSSSGMAIDHTQENSRSPMSLDCEEKPAVEVSRTENLNFRNHTCSTDNRVAFKEPSASSQRLQTKEISGSSQRLQTKEVSGSSQRVQTKEPPSSSQRLQTKEPPSSSQRLQSKEPSGSSQRLQSKEPSGSSQRLQSKEPSGSSQRLQSKEPSSSSQRLQSKEFSSSAERLQTHKQATALKNLENLSKSFESPRKLGDQTLLDSISQDYHESIVNTSLSPMKTRGRIKCQLSFDKAASRKTCVVFGEMLKKHSTESGSRKIVRVELKKKEKSFPEASAGACSKKCKSQETNPGENIMCSSANTNIDNLPKMKISQVASKNIHDPTSQSTLDIGNCESRSVLGADFKKTNPESGPSCTSRNIENDPFDRIVKASGQQIPYSVLVWSSDSEDDPVTVKTSAKDPSFKWSVEPVNLKTYSRKQSSETNRAKIANSKKNHAKIARWLRLLPSNFRKIKDDSTLDEDADESRKLDSPRESESDQHKERNLVDGSSVGSGPDFSVSQLENNSRGVGDEEMTKCWKQQSTMKTDVERSSLENGCQKRSEYVHGTNDLNHPLDALNEKNSDSPQSDEEIDLSKITAEEVPDIQEYTLGTSADFSLENISVYGPSPEEEKREYSFAEPKDPVDGESIAENINPFEFIESPKVSKQRKRKKSRRSSSKMPELSFQNRLTRSFQKHLSRRNSAVLPSAQGPHVEQISQEGLQDKIPARKEPLSKEPVKLGTQITLGNYATSCPQEKSIEHLTPDGLKSSKKEKGTGILAKNTERVHGSIPASSRFPENSLKGKKTDGLILDVGKSLKGQVTSGDDSKLDGQSSDHHRTSRSRKEVMEETSDLEFVAPLPTGNNRRKSGQRRRSGRPSKADDKISEELEILDLVNKISSAEEHDFLFNSQDVCHSFDVSVDNQNVSNNDHNVSCDKSNDTCNKSSDRSGGIGNVTCSVTASIGNKSIQQDISKVQNSSIENKIIRNDPNKTKDTDIISQGSIGHTCTNNKETDKRLTKALGKNNSYGDIGAGGTKEHFSVEESTLEGGQKTCSRPQQHKDDGTEDKFIKPAEISILRRGKRSVFGTDSLKKNPPASASSSSTSMETNKSVIAETIISYDDQDSKTKDTFIQPVGVSASRKLSDLGSESSKKDHQISASVSAPSSLEKSKSIDAKTVMLLSSVRNLLQSKDFNSKEFLAKAPSAKDPQSKQLGTKDTVLCRTTDLVPSLAGPDKASTDSRIHADKQRVNTADGNISTRTSKSINFQLNKRTVRINGQTFKNIDSVPLSNLQDQLENCQKSEQCPDQPSTPVVDATNQLNAQGSGSVPQTTKNTRVCKREVPVTPTVIPESPFSEVATPNPDKNAMETPALQPAAQRNSNVRFSSQVSVIYRPKKFDEEADGKGMNPEDSLSVEKVRSLQNSGLVDPERSSRLRECDGDDNKPKTDDLKSGHLVIGSEHIGVSDVGGKHFTLCMSNTERQTVTDCIPTPLDCQEGKEGCAINAGQNENEYNQNEAEEFGEDSIKMSQTAEPKLGQKPNLRFCGPAHFSITDNSEVSCDESVSVDTQPIENSSQQWMNEDLLPLAGNKVNQIRNPSKAAKLTERSSKNLGIQGDKKSNPAGLQTASIEMGKVHPSLQNQGKKNLKFVVTRQHVAHLPGNYHHLNDGHPFRDQRDTPAETSSDENGNLMAVDEDSEGHSSGTEDLNINPDPSEFELPDFEIQPETVKKLLTETGTTFLIKNGSPRFGSSATEPDKTPENPKIPANVDDQNLEKSPMSTRSKTSVGTKLPATSPDLRRIKNSCRKKSSVKKRANLSGPSGQENLENLILGGESIASSDQMSSNVSSSDHSSPTRNLASEDERPPESSPSPCQILCYSSEDTTKESPKTKELPSRHMKPEVPISKAANSNVQALPNVRLVDYDISQSSLVSETDSDSVPSSMQLGRRRLRSSSRLQNQLPKSPKTSKAERRKSSQIAKSTNSDSQQDSSEYSTNEILPPTADGEPKASKRPDSLSSADSWITVSDNLESATILKSQYKTNDSVPEELVLPKSGVAEKVGKNSTMTESETFLSTSERKFLKSGLCEVEEFSEKTEIKEQSTTVNRKETDDANLTMEPPAVSSEKTTEADGFSGNSESLDFGKVAKSASQETNTLAPTLTQSSENTSEEAAVSPKRKTVGLTECLSRNSEPLDFGEVAKSASQEMNTLAPTLTQGSENTVEEATVSSKTKTEALAGCLPGNSDFLDSGRVASQDVNSLAPTLAQSSEATVYEDTQSENTLAPTQSSDPNPFKSINQSDLVLENQDNGAISKKGPILTSETVKNDSLRVDILYSEMVTNVSSAVDVPDTEFVEMAPVLSLTDSVISDSAEPIPATPKELQYGNIPNLRTSNQNLSQNSNSSCVPCSVEQDGSLAHVLGAFHDVYTRNYNTALSVCDADDSKNKNINTRITNDILENGEKNSKRSTSLIIEDDVEKISVPGRVGDKSCARNEMVLKSDIVQDNPQKVGGDIIKESPIFLNPASTTSSADLNTSKISFSTECHLMIDSQNFFPVKRSKRKCFSLGGGVQESPTKSDGGDETVKSTAASTVTLTSPADAKSPNVKLATKVLSVSPTFTETSHQTRQNLPSRFDKIEKDGSGKFQETSGTSLQDVLEDGNSSESCVLLPCSQIEELAEDEISICGPKQNHQFVEEEQSSSKVSKRTKSGKKSSKTPSLIPKSGNKDGCSDSGTEEPVNIQESVSSLTSFANNDSRLRSSPRLRERNKSVAKKQNEDNSLESSNQRSVSSKNQELQRKCLFKNSGSSKDEPEPSYPSPTDSDTQQPSCPLSSAEDMEVENAVICDPEDVDHSAVTQEPSLDFSELDTIMYSPQGQSVGPMLGLESDQHEPQDSLEENENNSDREESVAKEDAKDQEVENVLELRNEEEEDKLQEDSQNGALSSASTKCPSGFSDNSVSAPGSQMVLSNPADTETDSSKNLSQMSKIRRGLKVSSQDEEMEILVKKLTDPDKDSATVTELSKKRVKEKSVGIGFATAENNNQLTTESKNGHSQDKVDDDDDSDSDLSLPDIPSSFPQAFYPEANADKSYTNASFQQNISEEVSDTAETSADEKIPKAKHLESNSAEEGSSQQGREGKLQKVQISNSDTKRADSSTVNKDAVIVIDKDPDRQGKAVKSELLDCDGTTENPAITARAEAESSNGQSMASSEKPVAKNLSEESDITGGQQSKDEETEDSEPFTRPRNKRPRRQVINDDSDDGDDEKVEFKNPGGLSASSPSTLSTQSEKFSTQQCTHLEEDLEEMKKQIAQLEARLGLNDSAGGPVSEDEEDAGLQDVKEEPKLPALAEQVLPPEVDCKISKKVTQRHSRDQMYIRLSSSSDDDDDDCEKKVIPDSDPEDKNLEPNTSSIFPVQKGPVADLHSSGEESEDLFFTPGSPVSLPQVTAPPPSRHKPPGKTVEAPPINQNLGKKLEAKRRRSHKDGTNKSSRLRIESSSSSSSSEEDVEVVPEEKCLRPKPFLWKAHAKENKRSQMSGISENKKADSLKNSEESLCGTSGSAKNLPRRSPRKHPRTLPKVKPTPQQNESSSPVLKELSVANTTERMGKSQPRSSHSPVASQGKDSQQKKTMCFIGTGLTNIEVNQVKRLASLVDGQFALRFSGEVTHVIVKTVSEKVRYCDRTLKYFLGIANKSWIVSYKWIQESLDQKQLLKEDEYEIIGDCVNGFAHRGPTRSRLSHAPLFKQFEIHVVGQSSELPQDDLMSLVKMAGGRVVADPEEFSSEPGITCLAIAGSSHSLKDFRRLKSQMKIYNILLVSREWILDSVAMFRVQPLESYIQLS